ncbi:MAG TPA: hypothetical protein VK841_10800 [Polyangiaceae bacterium]|jgi:hypothetical protein|nr:hypothetical protein [Polyangiaceae bacterium]
MMDANDAGEVAEMLESMTKGKLTAGEYEASENILHLRYPRRVELASDEAVQAFFDEVIEDWIRPCPNRPYLLVNFANLHIRPNMAEAYAKNLGRFQGMLLGTYRYGVPASFTGVAVALGNLKLASPANIFADERTAREAIRVAKERASRRRKSG